MRTADEIYQEMRAVFAERAGFAPEDSCDLAVRLYAAAAQVQALECQAEWVLDQCFPQTAQGKYLDDHAALRGLSRQEAAAAVGTLRFSSKDLPSGDLEIPAGTVCMTAAQIRFETTEDAVLQAGSAWVDVPARAVEPGGSGNAAAGSVSLLVTCPVGITACTNPAAFTGGTDAESDEALRARVLESYRRLPNGANAAFYEEQSLRHDGVAAAVAVGRARGIGTVDVYIATAAGVPDQALLDEVQADLQARREIAVDVKVLAPTVKTVDIQAELEVAEGVDFEPVRTAAEAALAGRFTGKLLGRPVRLAELGSILYGVEGVVNYHILSPAADAAADATALPTLGTVQLTRMKEEEADG